MQSFEQKVHKNALIAGLVSYMGAIILYSLLPNEANDGTTAWLFTMHIPIIVGFSVSCLVYFSLHNNLSRRHSLLISSLIIVLILRGHQFGTLNPIGPDGWFFAELSQRYADFGPNPTINSYLARPGCPSEDRPGSRVRVSGRSGSSSVRPQLDIGAPIS